MKLPGLVVQVGVSQYYHGSYGVFSAAAAGPAELLRITMSPPYCVRFFATSALEGTSSVRDHCR